MRYLYLIMLVLATGCMSIKKYESINTDLSGSIIERSNIVRKEKVIDDIIMQTNVEKGKDIGLTIQGKVSLRDAIQIIFTALGTDYIVLSQIEGQVDMKVTKGTSVSLMNLLGFIIFESGYQMHYKDGVVVISTSEVPVLFSLEDKIWNVKIIEVDSNLYADFLVLLKNFDKSVLDNVRILKGFGGKHLLMYTNGYNISVVDIVLDKLKQISNIGFYLITVNSRDVEEISKYILDIYPDEKFITDKQLNSILVFTQESYKKINELIRLIDKEQYQFMLTLYLLDINQSEKLNFGMDINYVSGDLSLTTALRESVGIGVAGYVDNLSLTANYLVQEYSGRVLVNPKLFIRNGVTSSFSFGQRIPTLSSKASVSSDIIQSVSYVTTGVNVAVELNYLGGNVQVKMSVSNSAVLESVGVEGNPLFSNDSVSFDYVQGIGKTAILAGFKRIEQSNSRNKHFIPFFGSFFKKEEKREYVILSKIDLINIVNNDISIENL